MNIEWKALPHWNHPFLWLVLCILYARIDKCFFKDRPGIRASQSSHLKRITAQLVATVGCEVLKASNWRCDHPRERAAPILFLSRLDLSAPCRQPRCITCKGGRRGCSSCVVVVLGAQSRLLAVHEAPQVARNVVCGGRSASSARIGTHLRQLAECSTRRKRRT